PSVYEVLKLAQSEQPGVPWTTPISPELFITAGFEVTHAANRSAQAREWWKKLKSEFDFSSVSPSTAVAILDTMYKGVDELEENRRRGGGRFKPGPILTLNVLQQAKIRSSLDAIVADSVAQIQVHGSRSNSKGAVSESSLSDSEMDKRPPPSSHKHKRSPSPFSPQARQARKRFAVGSQ
ncbi:hypothetical protein JCM5350_007045, partial [Sporobolomyces pararoseus]